MSYKWNNQRSVEKRQKIPIIVLGEVESTRAFETGENSVLKREKKIVMGV